MPKERLVALSFQCNLKIDERCILNLQPTKINIMINFKTHSITIDVFYVVRLFQVENFDVYIWSSPVFQFLRIVQHR